MPLQFATQEFLANGEAALALLAGLLKVLTDRGVLKPEDIDAAVMEAVRIIPSGPGRMDIEARKIAESLVK